MPRHSGLHYVTDALIPVKDWNFRKNPERLIRWRVYPEFHLARAVFYRRAIASTSELVRQVFFDR